MKPFIAVFSILFLLGKVNAQEKKDSILLSGFNTSGFGIDKKAEGYCVIYANRRYNYYYDPGGWCMPDSAHFNQFLRDIEFIIPYVGHTDGSIKVEREKYSLKPDKYVPMLDINDSNGKYAILDKDQAEELLKWLKSVKW